MVLVDIYFPAIDRTEDFSLDENVSISSLQEEIVEMMMQMTHVESLEQGGQWMLCNYQTGSILPLESSLAECGIRNGNKLLMV